MRVAFSFGMPRSTAPLTNRSRWACMTEASFLPIALRSTSPSPMVNPPNSPAMRITCSW